MLFTSLEFLLLFFPIVYGINFLLPKTLRNYWLLLCSLFFYAWGEPTFILIMAGSIVFNYLCALLIEKNGQNRKAKKICLILGISVNLGLLFVYKYLNFITENLHLLIPQTRNLFPVTSIVLPIGISFFTFQAMSYIIDVYRGIPAQQNIAYIGLYISLFPQLIAGPIVRYTTIANQIDNRKVSLTSFSSGLIRFIRGFNKKVLLANVLSQVADVSFNTMPNSICMAWLGAICYALQIFFDFSGYSDMAIGLGRMLGFKFLKNFDYPYISKTITEFWRRWHISLGTWFRDYVYFPLGGSRVKSKGRLVFNLFVVWCLTGIWHGANWTFILWGLLYGLLIVIEKLTGISKKIEDLPLLISTLYRVFTLVFILVGWVLFRADTLTNAKEYLYHMFIISGNILWDKAFVFYLREYFVFIVFGLLCATPFFKYLKMLIGSHWRGSKEVVKSISYCLQLILFIISISFLVMNAHNPFIYFNF